MKLNPIKLLQTLYLHRPVSRVLDSKLKIRSVQDKINISVIKQKLHALKSTPEAAQCTCKDYAFQFSRRIKNHVYVLNALSK